MNTALYIGKTVKVINEQTVCKNANCIPADTNLQTIR